MTPAPEGTAEENERLVEASEALHRRVRAFARGYGGDGGGGDGFDALACDIARFQAERQPRLLRLYRRAGLEPAGLRLAREVPAVPADAFKLARIAAHPPALDAKVFRTSGTTSGGRGEHPFRTTATYDELSLAFGRRMLAPDGGGFRVVVLGPAPEAASDWSLGHMCALFGDAFGGGASWLLPRDAGELGPLRRAVERARAGGERVLLLATSFALVFLLDALGGEPLPLPAGSRVMQTGGYKGKSREVDADELRAALARCFGLDPRAVVSEYGMTELSSQAYEGTLRSLLGLDGGGEAGELITPPWLRIEAVDPATLAPLGPGAEGLARIVDLGNVDSAVAVQTADRVRVDAGGRVRLLGRAPGAPPRGCSLAI
ncbi:MAG TPA: acyl-protein synthetase, partial [Polyangiaceae bacterium]|nr:acyl-protein synthetase [Polyangiaceae bacterium]